MLGCFTKYVFLGWVQRHLYRRGPAILTFHRAGRAPSWAPDPFLYNTAKDLDWYLTQAREAGLHLVSLDGATAGGKPQPNTLAVTFDDGCVSVLEEALPVLARHKVRAIQFIVAGRIGGLNEWDLCKDDVPSPLMDTGQIRAWLAAGQDIGSHSMTHCNLRKVKPAQARIEIFDSKKRLEDTFGVPIRHFAFPYGGWRVPQVRELLQEGGDVSACTTEFGVSQSEADLWSLRRITPMTETQLVRKIWHRIMRYSRAS